VSLKEKKLLIFDLDGTLIDSVPDLATAVNEMLLSLKRPTFSEETIRFWVGNGAQTLVKRALSGDTAIDENLDADYFDEALTIFLRAYSKHLSQKTVTYPHVLETLEKLKDAGFEMTIVTNKPYDFVQPLLDGLDLAGYFTYYLGGDSLEVKKPDPLPLRHVCDRFGVSLDQSVMIGDSKNDILAANACNMDSIAVTYGYNYGEDIRIYHPKTVLDDFAEIINCLER